MGEQLVHGRANTQDRACLDIVCSQWCVGRPLREDLLWWAHLPTSLHQQAWPAISVLNETWTYQEKAYEHRVRKVEHSSFTPLVLAATSGMANEATYFCKRLTSCTSCKKMESVIQFYCVFSILSSVFPCYTQPFNASGELSPVVATPAILHLQLIWSSLSQGWTTSQRR